MLSLATHFTLAIVSERYIAILAKTTVLANQAKGGRDYSKPFNEFEIEEFFFFFFFFFLIERSKRKMAYKCWNF